MSDNLLTIAEPFDATVLDEQTELRALARAVQFAEDFTLLLVRCSQHYHRQRLVLALRKELPRLVVQEIHFEAPIDHLLDELRKRLNEPLPGAVFVSGLEHSLPAASDAHAAPLIANLNAARNSFPQFLPCPLVLWLPEYVLTAIMRGAPDFFSIRSGVYYFAATPQEADDLARFLAAGDDWVAANLTVAEKRERIAAIENILNDYQAFSVSQRDRRAEDRLLTRLGNLYRMLGQYGKAEECHEQSLAICQETGDRVGEGIALCNWGNLYRRQRRWEKAKQHYQQSLEVFHELGDRVNEGQLLNNIGNIYGQQNCLTNAEAYFQRSLAIFQEVGASIGQQAAVNNLGNVCSLQGRLTEAEKHYQRSLAICQETGNRVGERQTLENLASLRATQGDIPGALEFECRAIALLKAMEDKAGLEKARRRVAKWREQMSAPKYPAARGAATGQASD